MNTGLDGYKAEVYFQYQAMKQGLALSSPVNNLSPYDYIVDCGDRLIKCQVKKACPSTQGSFYECELRRTRSKKTGMKAYPRKLYKDGDFDFLCAVIPDGDIYIIPWGLVSDIKSRIILGGKKRNKYESFKENWGFIQVP